ncbi:hypothetical protein HPP92_007206 [Vanilla planifolia]|uniref:GATA-type domain-containing protein n=1 Tax=Vanilla planifolia TaxID=51239 RepID=A0A835VAF6_VANPL|nr:hypothetical protein HPP92_007206 [Vanilla planifolia]
MQCMRFNTAVMASEWEKQFLMGMGIEGKVSQGAPTGFTAAAPSYLYGLPTADTLRVDDLLDFTNHELFPASSSSSSSLAPEAQFLPQPEFFSSSAAASSRGIVVDGASSNSGYHFARQSSFTDDILIPNEEVAELEWLSKFVEDSFSDAPYQSITADTVGQCASIQRGDLSVPGRSARSKRSRGIAVTVESGGVASAWSPLAPSSSTTSSSSSSDFPTPKGKMVSGSNGGNRKKQGGAEAGTDGSVRRCTHCASEKTPQWRTGPLGPKTLCNACGVRFKSGRLVPEYRPAASPTFVLTQHSNSHRKVMELRRQKEMLILRHHENAATSASFPAAGVASSPFSSDAGRPEMLFHDYEVC